MDDEGDKAGSENGAVDVALEGDGPFAYPRSRLVSVSLTADDVILRLATIDDQQVELPIAIGSLPDLAFGVAAALKALQPANDDRPA